MITFEGVLGTFLPHVPCSSKIKTDTLILRPGVKEALTDLLRNFKVVVITGDQGSIHQKAMMKALDKQKAPYDAFYRTVKVENDNLFTYETILRDMDSGSKL